LKGATKSSRRFRLWSRGWLAGSMMPSGERANGDQGDPCAAKILRNRRCHVGRVGTLITAGIQSRDPIVVGLTGLHGVVSVGRGAHRGRSELDGRPARLRVAVHVIAYNARAGLGPREADKVSLSTRARASSTGPAWLMVRSPPWRSSAVATAGWPPSSSSIRAWATCSWSGRPGT